MQFVHNNCLYSKFILFLTLLTSLKNMFGGIDVSSESLIEDPKL